jgi:hypothetical protein
MFWMWVTDLTQPLNLEGYFEQTLNDEEDFHTGGFDWGKQYFGVVKESRIEQECRDLKAS